MLAPVFARLPRATLARLLDVPGALEEMPAHWRTFVRFRQGDTLRGAGWAGEMRACLLDADGRLDLCMLRGMTVSEVRTCVVIAFHDTTPGRIHQMRAAKCVVLDPWWPEADAMIASARELSRDWLVAADHGRWMDAALRARHDAPMGIGFIVRLQGLSDPQYAALFTTARLEGHGPQRFRVEDVFEIALRPTMALRTVAIRVYTGAPGALPVDAGTIRDRNRRALEMLHLVPARPAASVEFFTRSAGDATTKASFTDVLKLIFSRGGKVSVSVAQ